MQINEVKCSSPIHESELAATELRFYGTQAGGGACSNQELWRAVRESVDVCTFDFGRGVLLSSSYCPQPDSTQTTHSNFPPITLRGALASSWSNQESSPCYLGYRLFMLRSEKPSRFMRNGFRVANGWDAAMPISYIRVMTYPC